MDEGSQSSGKAITSLVLGLCSLVCSCFTGIPAIIFGFLALSDIKSSHSRLTGQNMAMTGIVLGFGGSALAALGLLVGLLLPAVQMARHAARNASSMNNMMQIGLALQAVATKDGAYPAQYSLDATGRPGTSWRVQLLPYMEAGAQFQLYHLDEPWNSPGNLQALTVIPPQFINPMDEPAAEQGANSVGYVAVAGPGFLFDGPTPHKPSEIRDGLSQTIMVVEVAQSGIALAEPRDLTWDEFLANFKARNVGRNIWVNAVFADGTVRKISYDTSPDKLRAYFTIDGGENVLPP
jgi:type II secretory pathway pseudopilin PulG